MYLIKENDTAITPNGEIIGNSIEINNILGAMQPTTAIVFYDAGEYAESYEIRQNELTNGIPLSESFIQSLAGLYKDKAKSGVQTNGKEGS